MGVARLSGARGGLDSTRHRAVPCCSGDADGGGCGGIVVRLAMTQVKVSRPRIGLLHTAADDGIGL